jgi:hypothetical protein
MVHNHQETLPPQEFARAVLAEVRQAGMQARTSVQSFDWRTLQVVEREAPEIATVYLTGRRGTESQPKAVHAAGGRVWSPYHEAMDSAWNQPRAQIARRGLRLPPPAAGRAGFRPAGANPLVFLLQLAGMLLVGSRCGRPRPPGRAVARPSNSGSSSPTASCTAARCT